MHYYEIIKKKKKEIFSYFVILLVIGVSGCASQKAVRQESQTTEVVAESRSVPQPGVEEEEQPIDEAGQAKLITEINTSDNPDSIDVSIVGTALLTYTSVKQPLPLGLVLYFPETALDLPSSEFTVESDVVESIKAAEIIEGGPSKVTISLKKDISYEVIRDGNGLKIIFDKVSGEPSAISEEDPETVALGEDDSQEDLTQDDMAPSGEYEVPGQEEPAVDLSLSAAAISGVASGTMLNSVSAEENEDGATISVLSDGVIRDYKSFTLDNPARIVIDLQNIKGPSKKQKVVEVNGLWVQKVRYFTHPDYTRVVLDTESQYLSMYTANPVREGLIIRIGTDLENRPVEEVISSAEEDMPAEPVLAQIGEEQQEALLDEGQAVPVEESRSFTVEEEETPEEVPDALLGSGNQPEVILDSDQDQEEIPVEAAVFQSSETALVNRTDFASNEDGTSTITIGLTHPVKYKITKIQEEALQVKIQLYNTKIPQSFKWPTITTRFDSAVDRIIPVYKPEMNNTSVIIVELREEVEFRDEQGENNQIDIFFDASEIKGRPYKEVELPDWKKVLDQTALEVAETVPVESSEPGEDALRGEAALLSGADEGEDAEAIVSEEIVEVEEETGVVEAEEVEIDLSETADAEIIEVEEMEEAEGEDTEFEPEEEDEEVVMASTKKYTGEKISLDFYKTDIKNVLRILRDVSGKNFAVDKDVKGSVTLSLIKPVPWDQVLDLVLKMNSLSSVMEGEVIRITTVDTKLREENQRRDAIKATQSVTAEIKAAEPLITKYISISYADASSDIKPHLEKILTDKRGTLSVDKRNNQIIITDVSTTIMKAIELVRKIDKVTPQVIIEARIVEVTETFSRDIGTEWGAGSNTVEGTPYYPVNGTSTSWNVAMNHPVANTGSMGFDFSRIVGTPFSLNAKLMASETEGDSKIISAPKIVTLDNRMASITQGVEVPYQKLDEAGNTTTEFKQVDLKLNVTPHVTPDNRITMILDITKNDVLPGGGDVPSLSTNSTKTELLVNDGDTIVIGGIVKSNNREGEVRFPFLNKIPVLGWFFKSRSTESEKTELLIFITPTIVHLEKKTV